jgi:glycosyltransferase involved in cell wall biosynthesis
MKLPRVLIVSHFAPPAVGGIERFLDDLAAAWVEAGGQAAAVAPVGAGFRAIKTLPGSLFPWRWIRPSYLPLFWRLPAWKRRVRAEFVLFGHASNALIVPALLSLISRWPYAVLVHGMDVRRLPRGVAGFVLGRARAVFANSRDTAATVRQILGADARTILLTPGTAVVSDPGEHDHRHGLFVGRLVRRKGLRTVLEALKAVRAAVRDVRFTVVGDGPERAWLERRRTELGLNSVVQFTGAVDDASLVKIRSRAGWFCLVPEPTTDPTDAEGFGIALLEAQAAGLPVVTAQIGGVRDAVAPDGALFVPSGDAHALAQAITRLVVDPELCQRLGRAGLRFASARGRWVDRVRTLAAALNEDLSEFGTIGVVVPAHNAARTLPTTLASIRRQIGVSTEVVVVDDGSSDRTANLAEAAGIRVVRQRNRGAPAARNRGARESQGEFLFFCDADVVLDPFALRELLRGLRTHPEAAFSYSSFRFGIRTHRCGPFDAERLRRFNYISTMSLIRREHFPGFDEGLPRLQDWDLWLTMLSAGDTGIWVPRYLFRAAPHGGGISGRLGAPPPEAAVRRIRSKHRLYA